jgi:hypothetical protein
MKDDFAGKTRCFCLFILICVALNNDLEVIMKSAAEDIYHRAGLQRLTCPCIDTTSTPFILD